MGGRQFSYPDIARPLTMETEPVTGYFCRSRIECIAQNLGSIDGKKKTKLGKCGIPHPVAENYFGKGEIVLKL